GDPAQPVRVPAQRREQHAVVGGAVGTRLHEHTAVAPECIEVGTVLGESDRWCAVRGPGHRSRRGDPVGQEHMAVVVDHCHTRSCPRVSGSSSAASASTPYATTANSAIAGPMLMASASDPTRNGNRAPIPRPKLYAKPWPEPRSWVGNCSVKNAPMPLKYAEETKPSGKHNAMNTPLGPHPSRGRSAVPAAPGSPGCRAARRRHPGPSLRSNPSRCAL